MPDTIRQPATTKVLSPAEVAQYHRDGFFFPIRIMSEADAADCERKLCALEAREGGTISRRTNMKPHLLVPWLEALVRHPKVLDAVEDVIGPNILAWGSGFFTKGAHDPSFVSWHQNSTSGAGQARRGHRLGGVHAGTDEGNGCDAGHPGQPPPRPDPAPRGHLRQAQPVDPRPGGGGRGRRAAGCPGLDLRPGEMSLHHVRLVHGSPPNASGGDRRIGYAIRYIPTSVSQVAGDGRQRHPGARRRPLRPFRARAAAARRSRSGNAWRWQPGKLPSATRGILYRGTGEKRRKFQRPAGRGGPR